MSQADAGTRPQLRRRTQTHPDERRCVPAALDGSKVIEGRPLGNPPSTWVASRQNRSQRPAITVPSTGIDTADDNGQRPFSATGT